MHDTNKDLNHKEDAAKENTEDTEAVEIKAQQALTKPSNQLTLLTVHRPAIGETRVMKDDFGILTLRTSCLGPRTLLFITDNPSKSGLKVTQSAGVIGAAEVIAQQALVKTSVQATLLMFHRPSMEDPRVMEHVFGILTLGSPCLDPRTILASQRTHKNQW